MRLLLGWALVLFGVVKSDDPLAGKLGGSVDLKPTAPPNEITSITWKEGTNLAVQWDGTNINSYRQFKTRSDLDYKTGILTIRDLVLSDSNTYTPEINNVLQNEIILKVYRPVPQPIIEDSLVLNEYCDLTCAGNTTDAEPVTYSWTKDGQTMKETLREITQKWEECSSTYTCTMTNPVSEMQSDPSIPTPNKKLKIGLGIGLGIPLFLVLLVVLHRLLSGKWFFQKDLKCWKADFWKRSTNQAGDARSKEETTSMAVSG